jgi:hypothetical protein
LQLAASSAGTKALSTKIKLKIKIKIELLENIKNFNLLFKAISK